MMTKKKDFPEKKAVPPLKGKHPPIESEDFLRSIEASVRESWGEKQWRGVSIHSDSIRDKTAPFDIAENILKGVSRSKLPVSVLLSKEVRAIGVDSSGKTVTWDFFMNVMWPATKDDNKFIDDYLRPAVENISGNIRIDAPLSEDPWFTYQSFDDAFRRVSTASSYIWWSQP